MVINNHIYVDFPITLTKAIQEELGDNLEKLNVDINTIM
ncbi:hypothetical protein GM3708_1332 [Geminocystis sp. NIES-3708]|nr:hypothetical protein GM3708_1332 [Geminocystis sp. NIES-3708]